MIGGFGEIDERKEMVGREKKFYMRERERERERERKMNKKIINPCAILLQYRDNLLCQSYHSSIACCKILTHLKHLMRLE